MDENSTPEPVGDAEAQVAAIMDGLTIEQVVANDISVSKTARDFRKTAHAATHAVCPLLSGRSGMSQEEKTEALSRARALLTLAADALDRAVEISAEKEDSK